MSKRRYLIKKIILLALFSALAYVLTFLAEAVFAIPLVPGVEFLSYNPKDVIICISGFALGPLASFIISFVVSLIEMVTISTTGFYGFVMNVFSTCSLVIPASLIYKYKKSFGGAIFSLIIGFISEIIMMTLWNIIITPIYMSYPRETLISTLLLPIVGFNALKCGLNVGFILLLYKPIMSALRASKLVKNEHKSNLKYSIIMAIIGLLLIVTLLFIYLLINKK